MGKAIKFLWQIVAVIGTIIIAAAEVSPKQVTSNLASWTAFLGVHVPSWLATTQADTIAKIVGEAFVVIAVIGGLFMGWRSRLHRERASRKAAESGTPNSVTTAIKIVGGGDNTFDGIYTHNIDRVFDIENSKGNKATNVVSTRDIPRDKEKK